ncbi:hypothetical protein ABZ709_32460 [Streptomyces albus]|uniref:hypothetical protein n=1 Tax=Streptomyces albus TaxID=1888 RepID=UPI0033C29427
MNSTHNHVNGTHGAVIQARDITGDIAVTTNAPDNSDNSHDSHTVTTDTTDTTDTVTFTHCTVNYTSGTNHGGMHH